MREGRPLGSGVSMAKTITQRCGDLTVDRHKNKTGIFALGRDEGPGFGGERTHGASSHKPPP